MYIYLCLHGKQQLLDSGPGSCQSAQDGTGCSSCVCNIRPQGRKLAVRQNHAALAECCYTCTPWKLTCRQTEAVKADPRLSQTSSSELGAASAVQALWSWCSKLVEAMTCDLLVLPMPGQVRLFQHVMRMRPVISVALKAITNQRHLSH